MILKIPSKMNCNKVQSSGHFVVRNDRGLHTRPCSEIVKCASSYKADVRLVYQKMEVNAKSMLGVLMLSAVKGAKIAVNAFGEDADDAVASLLKLAGNQFNLHY